MQVKYSIIIFSCHHNINNNNNNNNAEYLLQRPFIHAIADTQSRSRLTALPALFLFVSDKRQAEYRPNHDIIRFEFCRSQFCQVEETGVLRGNHRSTVRKLLRKLIQLWSRVPTATGIEPRTTVLKDRESILSATAPQ